MVQKIKSPEDLKALRDKAKAEVELRTGEKDIRVTVHMGTCGIAAGARDVLSELRQQISQSGLTNVTIRLAGCLGLCDQEPMMTLMDSSGKEYCYGKLDKSKVREIVNQHIRGSQPLPEYMVNR